ncbi:hypothetical protein [Terriglobus sp.]|uniref:hypothetical protein n=1 Tax=Terriglobus sp. TaxID=1889013 RepID=UPI003AFF8FC7
MNKLTIFGIAITVTIVVAYGAFVLLGAWIDGRRQAVRERGEHPVTTSSGNVEAREQQTRNDD